MANRGLPALIDFLAGVGLPLLLLLKQSQSLANNVVGRLELTLGYFTANELFKWGRKADMHNHIVGSNESLVK